MNNSCKPDSLPDLYMEHCTYLVKGMNYKTKLKSGQVHT